VQNNKITNLIKNADILCFEKGQYNEAFKSYLNILKLDSENFCVMSRVANLLRLQGKMKEAYDYVIKAIQLKNDYGYSFYTKIRILCQMGEKNEAHSLYMSSALPNDSEFRTLQQKAAAACSVDLYDESIKICEQILNKNNKDGSIWYTLGVANYYKREFQSAISDLSKALTYRPKHFLTYLYRAKSYASLSNYEHAYADIKSADKIEHAHKEVTALLKIIGVNNGRQN